MKKINVKIAKTNKDAVIPAYATSGSACFDLVAVEDVVVTPGSTALIKTGLKVEVPEGYKLAIYPRSGISLKTPLRMGNSVGQVDSDYRGEVGVIIQNTGIYSPYNMPLAMTIDNKPFELEGQVPIGSYIIRKGDRIAQGAIEQVIQAAFEIVTDQELSETDRGQGGFGSSGIR